MEIFLTSSSLVNSTNPSRWSSSSSSPSLGVLTFFLLPRMMGPHHAQPTTGKTSRTGEGGQVGRGRSGLWLLFGQCDHIAFAFCACCKLITGGFFNAFTNTHTIRRNAYYFIGLKTHSVYAGRFIYLFFFEAKSNPPAENTNKEVNN